MRLLSIRLGFSTSPSWFCRLQLAFVLFTSSLCSHPPKSLRPVRGFRTGSAGPCGSVCVAAEVLCCLKISKQMEVQGPCPLHSESPASRAASPTKLGEVVSSTPTIGPELWDLLFSSFLVSVSPIWGVAVVCSRVPIGGAEVTYSTPAFCAQPRACLLSELPRESARVASLFAESWPRVTPREVDTRPMAYDTGAGVVVSWFASGLTKDTTL